MSILKRILPYLLITAIGLYLLPSLFLNHGMGLMLLYLPAVIVVCATVYGFRNPFHWSYFIYAFAVGVIFLPTIFIFYNSTAFIYTFIFGGLALAGLFLGRVFAAKAP